MTKEEINKYFSAKAIAEKNAKQNQQVLDLDNEDDADENDVDKVMETLEQMALLQASNMNTDGNDELYAQQTEDKMMN
jgi:hypothetical protein